MLSLCWKGWDLNPSYNVGQKKNIKSDWAWAVMIRKMVESVRQCVWMVIPLILSEIMQYLLDCSIFHLSKKACLFFMAIDASIFDFFLLQGC